MLNLQVALFYKVLVVVFQSQSIVGISALQSLKKH